MSLHQALTYLALGRLRDQALLASHYDKVSNAEKNDLDRVFREHLSEPATAFAPVDKNITCLYCLGARSSNFPERHAFACLNEFARQVEAHEDGQRLDSLEVGALHRALRRPMKELVDRYDSPAKFDKTAEVREKVDNVRGIMQDNVKKILESHANIETLEQKTDNLRTSANHFQRNAVDLRRMMWWRNFKIKIILGIVVLALLLYILIPIIQAVA